MKYRWVFSDVIILIGLDYLLLFCKEILDKQVNFASNFVSRIGLYFH